LSRSPKSDGFRTFPALYAPKNPMFAHAIRSS
jgi:hypothetical protein